ncbi:MFS transporter [Ostreibacterium oceani]|uniref:MFS transporter n=1 Tax=Ostreibacterium oceani TaxID=2654998 RepID=A0A6N7EUG4_9GAMM|nr:MFS transporter [Ostreibacterium oceani]MPV85623.1 MFS transporter [Ostreibacterium oceani]
MNPSVYWLMLCYGLGVTVAVVSVTVSGLIGAALAPNLFWATLPYGLQFIGVMLSAFGSSALQAHFGRKPIIIGACLLLVLAAVLGGVSVAKGSFVLLCAAHFLVGVFLANSALLRFAALDLTPKKLHAKALSVVVFGGTFAALLGPFISRNVGSLLAGMNPYIGVYLAIGVIGMLLTLLIVFIPFVRYQANPLPSDEGIQSVTQASTSKAAVTPPVTRQASLQGNAVFLFAITCGGIAYGLMNMIMINSSIQMKIQGFDFNSVTYYIQMHVLAMFFPSLFNMKILTYLGVRRFIILGFGFQCLASVVFIANQTAVTFAISLIALGLAWNILYTAASYIVGELFSEGAIKFKAQGINDLVVGVFSAMGALSAGMLLQLLGWNWLQGFAIVVTLALVLFYWRVAKPLGQVSGQGSEKVSPQSA